MASPQSKPLELILAELISLLRKHKLCLGLAESCTGGLLSSIVTRLSGVSDIFMGGVVSYSYPAKVDLLGVDLEALQREGAVSEIVSRQMVRGACDRLRAHCGIAITGVAGPSGGTAEKPVGTVWMAVKGPGFEEARCQRFSGDRESVQNQSARFALELLLCELQKHS